MFSLRRTIVSCFAVALLVTLICSSIPGPAASTARAAGLASDIVLVPDAATWIDEQNSQANHAGEPTLQVGRVDFQGFYYNSQTLLRFPIGNLPAGEVTGATLKVYQTDADAWGQEPFPIGADVVTGPWDAAAVTWKDGPSSVTGAAPAGVYNKPGQWVSWDVTAIVQAWATGQKPNYGFLLSGDAKTAGRHAFSSANTGADSPQLAIIIREPPTFDFTITGPSWNVVVDEDPVIEGNLEYAHEDFWVYVNRVSGAPPPVTLTALDLPAGVEAQYSPPSGTPTFISLVTLRTRRGSLAAPGTYPITIRAGGGTVARSLPLTLEVRRTMIGDLRPVSMAPIQVVEGAGLVLNKGTVFSVTVESTFPRPVDVPLRLNLPGTDWAAFARCGTGVSQGVPPGWSYPTDWGPVTVRPGANHFILPTVAPGAENQPFNADTNKSGVLPCPCVNGVYCSPDTRMVPRPIASTARYSFTVDPTNRYDETDESNNTSDQQSAQAANTRRWRFLFWPISPVSPVCIPNAANVSNAARKQLDYLLGTMPIADGKIDYQIALTLLQREDRTGHSGFQADTTFAASIEAVALRYGYDFTAMIGCGDAGGTRSARTTYVGDNGGAESVALAHEFNHRLAPMNDVYALDQLAGWYESYCELPDHSRTYCCFHNEAFRPDGYVGLWCDFDDSGNPYCKPGVTKRCSTYCGCADWASEYDPRCIGQRRYTREQCRAFCETKNNCSGKGGYTYTGPDGRTTHPASPGFWVNRWRQTAGSNMYFMDSGAGPVFPYSWQRLDSTVNLENNTQWPDGFRNLLSSRNFRSETDPPALMVSGHVFISDTAEFDLATRIPEANLDLEAGAPGAYELRLLGSGDKVLFSTGFDLAFRVPDPDGGPVNMDVFAFRIPWFDGTRSLQLLKGAQLLAQRSVTANAPQVSVKGPNGGEAYHSGQKIPATWTGADADGGTLTYLLALSPDKGQTWIPAAPPVTGQSYDLDTTYLPEGEYLFRIDVTDGINSGAATSAGSFTVLPGKKVYMPTLRR